MSLKSFHLLFILSSLGLLAFTGLWAGRQSSAGNDHLIAAVVSWLGFAAAAVYLGWFIKKYRRLK